MAETKDYIKGYDPVNRRLIYIVFAMQIFIAGLLVTPIFVKSKNFKQGVQEGRQQVLDSIAQRENKTKKTSTILLLAPSKLRNQASTAKLPVNRAKQAINK